MAKKTLNEAVVRRFQKLANVGALNEMYGMREEEEAEEAEAAADVEMADADADAGAEMDADPEMDGESMDVDLTDEEAQAIIELGAKLEAAMSGGDEEPDAEMADAEMADAEMADADAMDAEEEIMEALRGISYAPSKSEVVNEVAKRVAKRLQTAKLHEAKLNRALGRK
jgi:hypothetical protein